MLRALNGVLWLIKALKGRHTFVGEGVCAFVTLVACVAFDPVPRDRMPLECGVELLP